MSARMCTAARCVCARCGSRGKNLPPLPVLLDRLRRWRKPIIQIGG
jgi:hypothetical protein